MATTYLVLSNRILRELNEVELTSSTFSSSRGIQTAVKDFINKSIHDIYNEGAELPLLHTTTTQALTTGDGEYDFPSDMRRVDFESFFLKPTELITNGEFTSNITSWTTGDGSPSYTSSGNGRLNLNDAAAYQSISTVKNKTYKIQVRVTSPNSSATALIVRVGTSAGGTQNLNTTIGVTNFGEGNILDTTFTATATTSYVYVESDGVQLDVDYIRVSRSDITPSKLTYISYDTYLQTNKPADDVNQSSAYGKTHTDLSAHGDNMGLPDRFSSIIVDRAKYYVYMLRSDPEHAQLADRDYQRKLKLLKLDYGTHSADYMRTDVISESIATNVGTRVVS
jgi:hypothetical protein